MNSMNKRKLILQKEIDLCLSNMRAIYKKCNEEQQIALKYKIQII